jgi:hypothetical protein
MISGPRLFYILLILGLVSCAVFWRIPGNKYEWMRNDPVVGSASTRLPRDPDSWAPLAFFAIPPLIVAVVNLVNAAMRLRGTMKTLAMAFSLLLLILVLLKFGISYPIA